jgi:anti-anti-sigma factor
MLTVAAKNSDEGVVLLCQGRIVKGDETAVLCAAIGQNRRDVTLDLAGVDAIDAAGIGLLVSLQAAGIYLRLLNPIGPIRDLLRVTQLDSVFEICESHPSQPMAAETAAAA